MGGGAWRVVVSMLIIVAGMGLQELTRSKDAAKNTIGTGFIFIFYTQEAGTRNRS
jgi:hypothetical protein